MQSNFFLPNLWVQTAPIIIWHSHFLCISRKILCEDLSRDNNLLHTGFLEGKVLSLNWGLLSDFPGEEQAPTWHILFGNLEGKYLLVVTQRGGSLPYESGLNQHPVAKSTQLCWRCYNLHESLKPRCSPLVVTLDPRTQSASTQEFSLFLSNLLWGNCAEIILLSRFIKCYISFTSCHQWSCTATGLLHWAFAASLGSIPTVLLELMQWSVHEDLTPKSWWVKDPVLLLLLCSVSNEISGLNT